LFAALHALALGCGRGEPAPFPPYEAPRRRPAPAADAGCEGLARTWPEARWVEGAGRLHVGAGSKVEVADASVLGGPYEEPLAVEPPAGDHALDVVVGRTADGPALPVCARLRFARAAPASWRELGDVTLDSDVLVLADGAAWRQSLGPRTGAAFAAVEADGPQLGSLRAALEAKGLPTEVVLPTLARATRPLRPGDDAIVRRALGEARARGRFLVEPASPGWDAHRALGERGVAELSFAPEAPPSALAVAAGRGSGAYAVVAGYGAAGDLVALEVRLAP
jgi:hypothetical protein